MNAYIRIEERSKINNLSFHLRKLAKEYQIKSKKSKRKEVIRIRGETNEIANRKLIERINETKSWFFDKIDKINKPLARLNLRKKERGHKLLISEMKEVTSL